MEENIQENNQNDSKNTEGFLARIKRYILFALNPVNVLQDDKIHRWYLYLLLPASGWLLFFLQVALDKNATPLRTILVSVLGFALGYITVLASSGLLTLILAAMRKTARLDQVISCLSLSHTYMTFSVVLGLVYNLFGFSSSVSFGITGLLCTLLPIYAGIRTLTKNNPFAAPLLATLIGVILLMSWQLILIIGL